MKNKQMSLVRILALTIVCIIASAFCACSSDEEEVCKHEFGAWSTTVAATCTQAGTQERVCALCAEKETKPVDALGHTTQTVKENENAATCTKAGGYEEVVTCTVCGAELSRVYNAVAALGHSWNVDAPICTAGQKCTVCDAATAALGHNYQVSDTSELSCTSDEKTVYTCQNCSDTYTVTTAIATGHTVTSWDFSGETTVSGETCKYEQIYTGVCSVCSGNVTKTEKVERHSYTNVTVSKAATCRTAGEKRYECVCGHYETRPYENATAHSFNGGETKDNITTYTCTVEGCTVTKTVIDAKTQEAATVSNDQLKEVGEIELKNAAIKLDDNTLDGLEGDVSIGATTQSASTLSIDQALKDKIGTNPVFNFTMMAGSSPVTNFGGKVTVRVPYTLGAGEDPESIAIWYIDDAGKVEAMKANYVEGFAEFETTHFSCYTVAEISDEERCEVYGHIFASTTTAPTCTEDGYTMNACERCGYTERTAIVSATGHSFKAETVSADCTTDGKTVYTCENDGCTYSYEAKIPAAGHDYAKGESVVASCTQPGYTVYTCRNCTDSYKEAFAQTAHSWNRDAADCGNAKVCIICNTIGEAATGNHTVVNGVCTVCGQGCSHDFNSVVTAATCTAGGYTTKTCNKCGTTQTVDYTEALGHDYESSVVAPTCTENGYTTKTCKICGTTETTDEKAALDHDYEVTVVAPTCTEKGYTTKTCKICGATEATDEKAALNHDYEVKVVAPTCTENGYTLHTCKICGDHYQDAETPASHQWDRDYPSCGYPQVCTVCGAIGLPATGYHSYFDGRCIECGRVCDHQYEMIFHEPAHTCIDTDGGRKVFRCLICNHEYTEFDGMPGPHRYANGVCELCGQEAPPIDAYAGHYSGEVQWLRGPVEFDLDGYGNGMAWIGGAEFTFRYDYNEYGEAVLHGLHERFDPLILLQYTKEEMILRMSEEDGGQEVMLRFESAIPKPGVERFAGHYRPVWPGRYNDNIEFTLYADGTGEWSDGSTFTFEEDADQPKGWVIMYNVGNYSLIHIHIDIEAEEPSAQFYCDGYEGAVIEYYIDLASAEE